MKDAILASVFRPANRFHRSTDLVRDFGAAGALEGYFATDFVKDCLARITQGASEGSTARAWRLTGDYGSGKSSFALFLAESLSNPQRLPSRLQSDVFSSLPKLRRASYVPLLVVGAREPMSAALVRGLLGLTQKLFASKLDIAERLERLSRSPDAIPDQVVTDLVEELTHQIVSKRKGTGLLLIIDEVGKFLEYAAQNPDRQDVFLLQKLGERASRSGAEPFLFVCLLHQGFNAYADSLATPAKREWEKVAGRLEEIPFQQPLDQVVLLLAAALNPDTRRLKQDQLAGLQGSMEAAIRFGWYGASSSRTTLRNHAAALYPIDPMVVPVMVRTFQRYGQNERSIFNFLFSFEPLGLQAFAGTRLSEATPLRIHHFYDYVRANLGHRLAVASYRTHWSVIESVVESFPARDALDLQVMKVVGMLNLLNSDETLPTEEAICWSVAGADQAGHDQVKEVLRRLRHNKHLFFRGAGRGYCLWPHSSVDIDARYEDAKRAIPAVESWAKAITRLLDTRPLVARRHYIEKGNLRYLRVVYCSVSELADRAKQEPVDADGQILVPLCESETEHRQAMKLAAEASLAGKHNFIRLIAVPRPLDRLAGIVLDSMRWDWIATHTPELNTDRYAREEVVRFQADAVSRLERAVQELVGLSRFNGRLQLAWFHQGGPISVSSRRNLIGLLSTLCDQLFDRAPEIHNELVNRHQLSSAAAGARMRLLECMFTAADQPDLGLPVDKSPPEKSIYLSVLKETGLHRVSEAGSWTLGEPTSQDPGNVRPAIQAIRKFLERHADERVAVSKLMAHLRQPPYGVRDGIIPILLAVVTVADRKDIAVYENGTFLRDVGKDAFLRLSKNPERFDIQFCRVDGHRAEIFQQLTGLLTNRAGSTSAPELLDLVRDLCGQVASLPEYSRQTQRLSKRALAVRATILNAQEPVRLVFHQLPQACGFGVFGPTTSVSAREARSFAQTLKDAVEEIRSAYPALEGRIVEALAQQLDAANSTPAKVREHLSRRAEMLLPRVSDLKLKALCLRLEDSFLPLNQWVESVGSLLGLRPPTKWKDEDEQTFDRELLELSGQFLRAEAVTFALGEGSKPGQAIRVALTQPSGKERQQVFFVSEDQTADFERLKDEISKLVTKHRLVGLAAASQVLWDQIKAQPK
jgi:hypothetical protein